MVKSGHDKSTGKLPSDPRAGHCGDSRGGRERVVTAERFEHEEDSTDQRGRRIEVASNTSGGRRSSPRCMKRVPLIWLAGESLQYDTHPRKNLSRFLGILHVHRVKPNSTGNAGW